MTRPCSASISAASARWSPASPTTAASGSRSPRRSPRPARRSASAPGRRRSASSRPCSSAASSTRRWRCPTAASSPFEKIYPLDAEYDTLEDVPAELRESRRYRDLGDFTIDGLAAADARRLRRARRRHRRPQPRQRPRGQEAAARDQPQGLPRRGRRRRRTRSSSMVAALRSDHARGGAFLSLSYMATRARGPRLRRRHVVGEGRARERHARRSRSRPAARGATAST